jgi:hypothetical protein
MRRKTLKKDPPRVEGVFPKFSTPNLILLVGEISMWRRKKKEKENNPKNSGHLVPQQHLGAAQALRSDQIMGRTKSGSSDTDIMAVALGNKLTASSVLFR